MNWKPPTVSTRGARCRSRIEDSRDDENRRFSNHVTRSLRSLRYLRRPPSPRRPAPSIPARVGNSAGHRLSAGKSADVGGIERGRSLNPSRARQARDCRERAQRVPDGEPSAVVRKSSIFVITRIFDSRTTRRTELSDLGLSTPRLPTLLSFITETQQKTLPATKPTAVPRPVLRSAG